MNTITMQSKMFHSYFKDKQYSKNAEKQLREYLKKYRETGECAFYNFTVVTDDNSSLPIYFRAYHDPENDAYGIDVIFAYYKRSENDNPRYCEMLHFYKYLDDDLWDVGVDLPKESDGINDDIIEDFGGEILEFPNELLKKIGDKAIPLICIFAKVQTSALKTSRKIKKLHKQIARESGVLENHQPPKLQRDTSIKLDERITLTIDESIPGDGKREFIRRCEAWMVRGHYRRYKSGKVVYIKPFKKGKGRLNDKNYDIKKTPQGMTSSHRGHET